MTRPHPLLLLVTLLPASAGCERLSSAQPAGQARIVCLVDRATRSVTCADAAVASATPPAIDASGSAIVLGAQRVDVALVVRGATWSDTSVAFDVAVRNPLGQPLGTTDGHTIDPRGLRVRLVAPPTATDAAGRPVAAATDVEGTAGHRYAEIVSSGATSSAQRWALRVPATAARVSFAAVVVAPVAYPAGWLAARPDPTALPMVSLGSDTTLRAVARDARGATVRGADVTWRSLTPAVATLDADGTLAGRAVGAATVVATCRPRCTLPDDTLRIAVLPAGALGIAVDAGMRHAISPYVYGANALTEGGPGAAGRAPWYGAEPPAGLTLNRVGGNRWSAYDWLTNASNAGADYRYQNDDFLGAGAPGAAVRTRVAASRARGAAVLLTVPMLPYVAGDAAATPLDTAGATRAERLRAHFVENRPMEDAAAPNAVHQDAFVRWVTTTFPTGAGAPPIFFSLDNEPDAWHQTHREILSDTAGGPRIQRYDTFIATSLAYARAIKREAPGALVFGPALATYTGIVTLGRHPSPDPAYGRAPFLEVYLDQMRQAESRDGRRWLDVLDVHYYPAANASGVEITADAAPQPPSLVRARLQAPRSLWDTTYDEISWVTRTAGGPLALVPRLRAMIAAHYPGTRLALSEYYFGRGHDVSGGLAEADALGIFGREGVFAAALWPQADVQAAPAGGDGRLAYAYVFGALRLFRDYDGRGATFGDTGLAARTTDVEGASAYASVDGAGRIVVVAINKRDTPQPARLVVAHDVALRSARVYTMMDGTPVPARQADLVVGPGNVLAITLPAMSASTIVLAP
ncbi:MAG: hypothetical protein JO180_00670 [Gemmatirosa sp.]|nr:hypothetical protein [Gemmatirosa sp.]